MIIIIYVFQDIFQIKQNINYRVQIFRDLLQIQLLIQNLLTILGI